MRALVGLQDAAKLACYGHQFVPRWRCMAQFGELQQRETGHTTCIAQKAFWGWYKSKLNSLKIQYYVSGLQT